MTLTESQLDDVRAAITRLINHNNGWLVVGSHNEVKIGGHLELLGKGSGIGRAVVIAESNKQEALADCAVLGFPGGDPDQDFPHYYRVMID